MKVKKKSIALKSVCIRRERRLVSVEVAINSKRYRTVLSYIIREIQTSTSPPQSSSTCYRYFTSKIQLDTCYRDLLGIMQRGYTEIASLFRHTSITWPLSS